MEAGTLFASISLMMLANGIVLAIVSRELPDELRPSASFWQCGIVFFATGCSALMFSSILPRLLTLILSNGLIVLGFTALYAAVRRFSGVHPKLWHLTPTFLSILAVVVFSTLYPSFKLRVLVITTIWTVLLSASAYSLINQAQTDQSLSRKILASSFCLGVVYVIFRGIVYQALDVPGDFTVESNTHWLNMLTPIFMAILPVVGTTAFLLMCSDKLRRQLEIAASTDYLTGLPNRRTFTEHGRPLFAEAKFGNKGFVVANLDVDNFKSINDTHGHEVGDAVLAHLAALLLHHQGEFQLIARTGGEEFAIIFADMQRALIAIEKIRTEVYQASFTAGSTEVEITVSVGVASLNDNDQTFEDVLRRADAALYRAKSSGRNRIEIADSNVEALQVPSLGKPQYIIDA